MREQSNCKTMAETGRRYSAAAPLLACIGAIVSVLAASNCCLPILPMFFAAGLAGSSAFLAAVRPYLLAASILFIAYGFYQSWRAKKCRRRTSVMASVLLWVAAAFVFISTFFPQLMANASASLLAR